MCRGNIRVFQMQFRLLKNFPKLGEFLKILNFCSKVSRFYKLLNFKILRQQFSLLCFSMSVVQIWCSYLVNRLLYGVLPETTFFTKTVENDLSLTSITFDFGWPRINFFQRMRRINARRGAENFKALFPTEFELLTKTHQGALCPPPIRSRVKWTIPPCSKLFFIPKLYVKRFSTFHWSCWPLFSKKYFVTHKKSTLKVLINFGFVTSFEDSHYILLLRYNFGAQLIQWFCYSKLLHVNCCSYQWSKWSIATSLSPRGKLLFC